jgi:hypothetical protein
VSSCLLQAPVHLRLKAAAGRPLILLAAARCSLCATPPGQNAMHCVRCHTIITRRLAVQIVAAAAAAVSPCAAACRGPYIRGPHVAFQGGAGGSGSNSWSPLAGLPRLPKLHHSYRVSNFSASNPIHDDMVRITRACPLSILDDNYWCEDMIMQCVTSAARHGAVLSINHSPWFEHYRTGNTTADKSLAPDCCPAREAAEMKFYRQRLQQTSVWIKQANRRLDSNVSVNAVLLDAERWTVHKNNASCACTTILSACLVRGRCIHLMRTGNRRVRRAGNAQLDRKHALIFNATRDILPGATVQWYDRGGYMYDGMGTGVSATRSSAC